MVVLVTTDVQRGIDSAPRDGIFDSLLLKRINSGNATMYATPA
jgi:hypothetical protein